MSDQNNGVQDNNQNAGNQNQGGAGNAPVKSAYELYDAADAALEAYQADPDNAELKTAYETAKKTAKETAAAERTAAEANRPPKEYKLTKPKESVLSDESVVKIAAYAKEHGLTQKQAEAQLNRENQILVEARQAFESENQTKMAEVQESWIATAKDDKEYGGPELPKNMELAKRVLEKYGTPEFKAILEDPKQGRFGNHPELVRVLVRIGKSMSEDQLILPGAQGAKRPVSAAEKLYGEGTVKSSGVAS